MPRFQHTEQGVIIEPALCVPVKEILVIHPHATRRLLHETTRRLLQQRPLERNQVAIIDEIPRQTLQRIELPRIQQPKLHQWRQSNQVGITGKGRQGLVRRIAIGSRPGG